MSKMDFKNFKHVSTNDKTTVLKHKDGHWLHVAHGKVDPDTRKVLLAMGGKVKCAEGGEIPGTKVARRNDYLPESGVGAGGGRAAGGGATISAGSAARGVGSANAIPKDQKPYGSTVNVVKPEKGYGKVITMAEGGAVEDEPLKDINQVIDTSYSLDPVEAAPALQQAYQVGTENAINQKKDAMLLDSELRTGAMPMDETEAEIKAADSVLQGQESDALARAKADAQRSMLDQAKAKQDMALAQKRAQLGLQPKTDIPMPQASVPQAQMPQPAAAPQQPQAPATGMGSIPDPTQGMMQGYNTQIQGINREAAAKGALGQEQAGILQNQQAKMAEIQNRYQNQFQELEMERKAHLDDIRNGHIDPNKYWTGDDKGNGGHSKIATAIGIILAGFNPTTKPNAAIEFLQKQMENNLNVQAKNLDSKQNLLSANLKQFGNLHDAMQMTRMMQNDIVANELQVAAAKAASPMAKAAALQAIGPLQRESAQLQQQLAMRRMMMGLNQPGQGNNPNDVEQMMGYLRVTNPELAKSMESRYVPGVGLASVTVPDKVREEIVAHKNFDAAAKDLMKWTKTHSTIIPGTPEYNTGIQKALVLQSLVREGLLGTVYREGEQPLLDKMIHGNPANLLKNFNTIPQLKELIRSNDERGNTMKKTYGLPQSAPEVDDSIVKGKDGKSYQKQVVNGKVWMVPVSGAPKK